MIDSDRHTRILLEVTINRTRTSPADNARGGGVAQTARGSRATKSQRKGGEVDIPGEFEYGRAKCFRFSIAPNAALC